MKKTEKLKSFALMLLFVSAALAVTVFMLPSGRISKTAKSVLSVFMVFCVIAPVFGIIGKNGVGRELADIFSGYSPPESSDNGEIMAEQAREQVAAALTEIIKNKTEIPFDISLDIDIGDDFIIDIKRVTVFFYSRPENLGDIAFTLEKELGFMPEFKVDDDEEN